MTSQLPHMSGADAVIQLLIDQGVDVIFGYPGGAVLPIYDALFKRPELRHILVRHEQGAVHAAEGYARATGKPGVVLVTSGPGATNVVTGLTDALMDSVPIVCISGQVPSHLIGTDAFQECDTVGITRPCTKQNWLVRDPLKLVPTLHEAFYIATSGRPGPVLVDIPKDIQFLDVPYSTAPTKPHKTYRPVVKAEESAIEEAIALIKTAKRPIFYTGGGVINSGSVACQLLREFVEKTGFPITSTLMGLGAYPASGSKWLGMLGMHGTYEANMAMYECDLMICVGARFDDRITGRLDAFAPHSKKIHIDIDPSSIGKCVAVDVPLIGDCRSVLGDMLQALSQHVFKAEDYQNWWQQIAVWKQKNCLAYKASDQIIKPQYALQRLNALTKAYEPFITTEVGQHQMWAAQFIDFESPNRWITSGGLGTMGYGLPAAIGVQIAHPDALVVDVAGEASILMNIQELTTAVQYRLPVKVFIINNRYMGMVRQWQELLHGGRYSQSYSEALPDFVKLAEAYHGVGLRVERPDQLDDCIEQMLSINDRPVLVDCVTDPAENCFPMIPSGKAHCEMLLASDIAAGSTVNDQIDDEGKILV